MKPKLNKSAPAACAVVALLLLAGCDPAPKYVKPPAPAPAAFKEGQPESYREGEGWKLAQPGDANLRGKWWEIYNDPQLNALEEQVQINNQSVIQAEASYRQAQALVVSARSQLFPTLGASPGFTNSRFSQTSKGSFVVGGTSAAGASATTTTGTTSSTTGTGTGSSSTGVGGSSSTGILNNFSLPFNISYEVDFWHRIRNQVAENTYSAQASSADVATALLSTQAEVATDYFEVRALDAERKILDDTVTNYARSLELTQSLFKAGIDSEEEVAQAQTQLDTARAQATDLGASRANFEHALAVLIGKPPATFALSVAEFHATPPPVPVAMPSLLLQRRPDIAAAERRVAAANAAIGVARAAYYPNLQLSADGGFQTSHFTQWFDWPSRFWSLGPSLSQTLLDGGARRALNEQAQANYDGAVASYRGTVLAAFQAVEDQLSTLNVLSKEVVQEQTAVNSAGRFLDLSLTRFKTGVDSYLNVITAQTTLLTNRETELQIQLRQMTASVALIMALGGGWDQSQLPQMKEIIARPPKWQPANATPTAAPGPTTPPNPPPLPENLPIPRPNMPPVPGASSSAQ
jgi:NodT family efflux transporter outer membrane factor (OMF) lipoprotein